MKEEKIGKKRKKERISNAFDSSRSSSDAPVTTPVVVKFLDDIDGRIKESDRRALLAEKKSSDAEKRIDIANENIKEVRRDMFYVLLIVVVMFVIAFFAMLQESQKDEWLYTEYSDLYKIYSEENSILKNEVHQQQLQINNFESVLRNLKTNHSWLKISDF